MITLNTYLSLGKQCREAMTFYQTVLGGDLFLMPVEDTPIAAEMPPELQHEIMHSTLTTNEFRLMATGISPGPQESDTGEQGGGASLVLSVDSDKDVERLFNVLSNGGKILCPLGPSFFAVMFGSLTDRFGVTWNVVHELPLAN